MDKRSTVTNLAYSTQVVSNVLNAHNQVDTVYIDFPKAFDRINHAVPQTTLDKSGLSNRLGQHFSSYRHYRTQYVCYNGFKSKIYTTTPGVPQCPNVRPLLFNTFVNDLLDYVECGKCLY
ncbi:hypothetical protein Trydic_g19564 [Trypoxylus dichotomus]